MDRPNGIDRRTLARHVSADVDRVAPLLARILLVRAIRQVRYHYGRGSLWVADDVISDCGGARGLAVAGAATRELARTLAPAHDVERDLTTAIAMVKQLNWTLIAERNAYADYSMVTDPDNNYIDPKRSEETWKRWQEHKDRIGDATGRLPADLGSGKVGSLLLDRAVDRVFERGWFFGIRAMLSAEEERLWRRQVLRVLLGAARVAPVRGRPAATGSLADDLRRGGQALVEATPNAWARQATSRLEEIAVPVLTGQEPLDARKVTVIRLTALCLTRESEAAKAPAAGEAFRDIVAGITLIERDTAAGSARDDGDLGAVSESAEDRVSPTRASPASPADGSASR